MMSVDGQPDTVTPVTDDEDDDFGSFDDVSFDEPEQAAAVISTPVPNSEPVNIYDRDETAIARFVEEKLSQIIPLDDPTPVGAKEFEGGLLNERSYEILKRLTHTPVHTRMINESTWKKSTIRREMLLNLGIPLNLDEITISRRSKVDESEFVDEKNLDLPDYKSLALSQAEFVNTLNSTDEYLESLNIQQAEYFRSITSEEKLQQVKIQLESELVHVKKLYVTWKENERNLKKDNMIFQDYIENMVGNELKFRNEKSILQRKKSKRK